MLKIIKKFICLVLIFAVSASFSSCKKETAKIPVADGEKIVYGQNINLFSYYPDTLNPFLTNIKENYDILTLIYEPLFAVRDNGEAVPCLAAGYEVLNNGLKVVVNLRENVKFQNGADFGADDVIFTLKYIAEYAPSFLYVFDNIQSYSKDGLSVVFNLKSPQFNFVSCLDFPIVSRTTNIQSFNGDSKFLPNGCGAFSLDASSFKQKEMRLVKNESYYKNEYPYAGSICVKFLKDESVAVSAFNSNEISALTSDEFMWGDVSFTNEYNSIEYGGEWFYFLAFNYDNEILCDENVRRMILSMIDKEDLVQKVFQSHAYPTNSIINPMYYYGKIYSSKFDLDNADDYAKNASFTDKDKNGIYEKITEDVTYLLSFDVLVNGDDDKLLKIADFLSESAKKAKMRFNIIALSGDDYLNAVNEKSYDILITKEKIGVGENLASKIDFNAKYIVPYEIYEKLSAVLNEINDKNINEKVREFNDLYISLAPCVAICYDSSAMLNHYSLRNMTAWQKDRYRGILESFIKY